MRLGMHEKKAVGVIAALGSYQNVRILIEIGTGNVDLYSDQHGRRLVRILGSMVV
jgi:hypothetical protein